GRWPGRSAQNRWWGWSSGFRRRRRVAIWGTFDVDNYGDHLFPRIARRELEARVPGVVVDAFSPFGSAHPTRFDDADHPVEAFGEPTDRRLDALADRYDAVLVGGGELLHLNDPLLRHFYTADPDELARTQPSRWFLEGLGPARERRCPVVWHGLGVPFDYDGEQAARVRTALARRRWATVRDHASAARLRAVGVSAALEVEVVPDSGLLVDRLLPPAGRARRQARLRADGVLPPLGTPALVLQGCDLLVPAARHVAAALTPHVIDGGVEPVLLETGRCRRDGDYADALTAAFGPGVPIRRVPPDAPLEDVIAVLGAAAVVVASSLHAAVTAVAHRRPFVVLNLGAEAKLDGFGVQAGFEKHVVHRAADLSSALDVVLTQPPDDGHVAALQSAVDRHFDRLAAVVAGRSSRPACATDGQ
ncbi:MAG TPA: polysaccharide pyruvyl transferase family protein, partial [Acidimicrobiales bacterium]|nr:polysaccharide pyruvyl transferase family protein [Acidimicrobiales bacterium]